MKASVELILRRDNRQVRLRTGGGFLIRPIEMCAKKAVLFGGFGVGGGAAFVRVKCVL